MIIIYSFFCYLWFIFCNTVSKIIKFPPPRQSNVIQRNNGKYSFMTPVNSLLWVWGLPVEDIWQCLETSWFSQLEWKAFYRHLIGKDHWYQQMFWNVQDRPPKKILLIYSIDSAKAKRPQAPRKQLAKECCLWAHMSKPTCTHTCLFPKSAGFACMQRLLRLIQCFLKWDHILSHIAWVFIVFFASLAFLFVCFVVFGYLVFYKVRVKPTNNMTLDQIIFFFNILWWP